MAETKYFEVDNFQFQFTPNGNPTKGLLVTSFPELQPCYSSGGLDERLAHNKQDVLRNMLRLSSHYRQCKSRDAIQKLRSLLRV